MSSSGTTSFSTTVDPTKEFMLFGVHVVVDSMRKSVSLNNLSRSSMDRVGAQVVSAWIAESRKRILERDLKELCQESHINSGGWSCSEILSPSEQPQSPSS